MVKVTSEAIQAIPVVVIIPVNRNRKKTIIIDIPVSVTVKTEAEMGIEAVITSRSLLRPPKWWGPHLKRWAAVE